MRLYLLNRRIGDFFEVGFTPAGALHARPCHLRWKRWTFDARAGRTIVSGVSGSWRAQRDVCRSRGAQPFSFCSILHLGSWRSTRGRFSCRELFCFINQNSNVKTALPTPRVIEPAIARSFEVWRVLRRDEHGLGAC